MGSDGINHCYYLPPAVDPCGCKTPSRRLIKCSDGLHVAEGSSLRDSCLSFAAVFFSHMTNHSQNIPKLHCNLQDTVK